jgi:lipopolysaccharide transport system ATP-binding protein
MDVIKVENLYKQYRLGQVSTGSIAHDLNRWWHTVRGKEDPYEKITGLNNRDEADCNEYVWALQDINFSVKQGEVLGIIGRNGAGKSTLLKILSKVTSPTKGNIKVKGRIASLLEVGTGFHPELTGRENIFLNGAILGMTKSEIRSKFDEIVAFSGVEKYIDTPVKRYSSGMYVRLAFAVAAHLEPEILIVDEVLAVGDAEFQKKCLGKMKDVSGEGRTVLFVSHNMGAVASLCNQGIFMEHGKIIMNDRIDKTITTYLNRDRKDSSTNINWSNLQESPGDDHAKIVKIQMVDDQLRQIEHPLVDQKFGFLMEYVVLTNHFRPGPNFLLCNQQEEKIFQSLDTNHSQFEPGRYSSVFWFEPNLLNDISYRITMALTSHNPVTIHATYDIDFAVLDNIIADTRGDYKGQMHGLMRPKLTWETKRIN